MFFFFFFFFFFFNEWESIYLLSIYTIYMYSLILKKKKTLQILKTNYINFYLILSINN